METTLMSPFDYRLIVLVSALVVNALLGGPPWLHRALMLDRIGRWPARLLSTLERKLNRARRSPEERQRRGTLLVVVVIAAGVVAGFALSPLLKGLHWGDLIEVALLASLLKLRQAADFTMRIARLLASGEGEKAREALMEADWKNAALLDHYGMSRAATETLAVLWCERVISPALWYALFGLPGLFACAAVTLLATTTAQVHEAFGRSAQAAARWVHAGPSIVASLLLVLASMFLPFCKPLYAADMWVRCLALSQYRHRQLAVTGAALNLSLGGPTSVYAQGAWIGGAVARVHPRDAERASVLLWTATLVFLVIAGALALTP